LGDDILTKIMAMAVAIQTHTWAMAVAKSQGRKHRKQQGHLLETPLSNVQLL
jgi:hypothetical protein